MNEIPGEVSVTHYPSRSISRMIQKALAYLNDLLYSGVSREIQPHLYRRILFSNIIYLSLPVVYLAFILLDLKVYLSPFNLQFDQLTVPFIALHCAVGLFLNRKGYSYFGRVLFLVLWPLIMHILPVIVHQTPSDYYLAYPMGIIFHGILIQLTISYRYEKFTYFILLGINLILILTAKDFLLFFDDQSGFFRNGGVVASIYYRMVALLYWLLITTILFYVMSVLDRVIDRNIDQQQELLQSNIILHDLNDEVASINRTLENKVAERTLQLEKSNRQLTSYAYYNAHTIRGPFCRIKGILMLRQLQAITENEFNEKMMTSMRELEAAIDHMQHELSKAENAGNP